MKKTGGLRHHRRNSWKIYRARSGRNLFRSGPSERNARHVFSSLDSFVAAASAGREQMSSERLVSEYRRCCASSVGLCLRRPSRLLLRIEDKPERCAVPRQSPIYLLGAEGLAGMRTQLHARRLAAVRAPAATRTKHRSSLRHRPSFTAVTPSGGSSTSLRRAVQVDDRELFRRARRVQRWQDLSRNSEDHTSANLASQGWKWRRQKKGFELFTRQSPMLSLSGSPLGSPMLSSLLDSEFLAVGNVACSIGQLASPLRAPSESNYNSLMHTMYGSDFIYGSLVHKATFRRRSRTRSADAARMAQNCDSSQLLVKTCSFVHNSMFDKKNEQMCYVELFSPTSSGGFSISACSLAGREVIAGKVRPPLRHALHQLHPFSASLSAEPASSGVHVVFRARFHHAESDGSCSSKVMNARLWKLAKGVCKLGKLVDSYAQPPRGLNSSCMGHSAGEPRNSRCIVCTRNLCPLFMTRSCSRCELCSYNVCLACCSEQHVAIYNRHVAPLLVCARCRESLARDEFDSQLRAVNPGAFI